MAHPPGSETRALPSLATSGPSTRTEARMVFTRLYGASASTSSVESRISRSPLRSLLTPICSSRRMKVRVSLRSGTLWSLCLPGASSVAAIRGRAAFFAPLIRTSPCSGRPPSIISFSIFTSCCIRHFWHAVPDPCRHSQPESRHRKSPACRYRDRQTFFVQLRPGRRRSP